MTYTTETRRSAKLPSWLRRRIPLLGECARIESTVRKHRLRTICREALCPNRAECYGRGKVTFVVLGDTCTRDCSFCAVRNGMPAPPDRGEPARVASAARELRLGHVVVTSVTRDDLPDGGGGHYAAVIRALRRIEPAPVVEVLVPDFGGRGDSLPTVLGAGPDILSHNIETVRRLFPVMRRGAGYGRSLRLLERAKRLSGEVMTKSALMVGLGETRDEIEDTLGDLRRAGCDFVAIGQYLRPGMDQAPIDRFYNPAEFEEIELTAYEMGFLEAAAGPLVRSSYQENDLTAHRAVNPGAQDARRNVI